MKTTKPGKQKEAKEISYLLTRGNIQKDQGKTIRYRNEESNNESQKRGHTFFGLLYLFMRLTYLPTYLTYKLKLGVYVYIC